MLRSIFSFAICLALIAGLFLGFQPAGAQEPDKGSAETAPVQAPPAQSYPNAINRGLLAVEQFDVSPPLSFITPLQPKAVDPQTVIEMPERPSGLEGALGPQDADAAVQDSVGPGEIPAPSVSFNSLPNLSGVSPPDPVGDVGPNHYVAMSNLSFQIHDKSGGILYGPALNNTLWAGFGGACQTENSGDPIVVYDQLADRWILSQFTAAGPTYYVCVAISQTGDPLGAYYRYAVNTGSNFPDYPKMGVWNDGYYITTREFSSSGPFAGVGVYALNRANLLNGNPTPQIISFVVAPGASPHLIGDGLLPADIDGNMPAPAGSPEYLMGLMDNGGPYAAPQDALTLWKFTAVWHNPGASSLTLATPIAVAAFDSIFPCTPTARACIPQPGTANKLDILSYRQRPLWRLAYRNYGTHESLVTNHAVEVVHSSISYAGVRWYELRSPNNNPAIYQQGTYAPNDGIHRWMGSIAMDRDGNMGLGYSASNGTNVFPSSYYTGRLATDSLGTMPQGEGVIVAGTGSQTASTRWGDYTSMNVDPTDDCTFWYVNQWVPTTSSVGWQLRVGSFKFPTCGVKYADLSLDKTGAANWAQPGSPITYTMTVTNHGPSSISLGKFLKNHPTPITINDAAIATPYPSAITVPPQKGLVKKVTVTLYNISHTFPDDLDILLVGPEGQSSLLMSDAGSGLDLINHTLTFDSAALGVPPDSGVQMISDAYIPSDFDTSGSDEVFPAPAPAGPYTANLSVFDDTNPDGTWSLYVLDDVGSDVGKIYGGWNLTLDILPAVYITDQLPAGVSYDGFNGTKWDCGPSGGFIVCTYADPLALTTTPPVTIFATAPATSGLISNVATADSGIFDNNFSNNTDTFDINVNFRVYVPFTRK